MTEVGILVFDEVEVLDFAGPFEVFSVSRLPGGGPAFEVTVIGEKDVITAANGLRVCTQRRPADVASLDVLVIPGGYGARKVQKHNQGLLAWIRELYPRLTILASVCTGAFVLGTSGLIKGLEVTTHWAHLEELQAEQPECRVKGKVRFVDAGKVVTSAGISAGIEMSLHLVKRLHGLEVANETARQMESRCWEEA